MPFIEALDAAFAVNTLFLWLGEGLIFVAKSFSKRSQKRLLIVTIKPPKIARSLHRPGSFSRSLCIVEVKSS